MKQKIQLADNQIRLMQALRFNLHDLLHQTARGTITDRQLNRIAGHIFTELGRTCIFWILIAPSFWWLIPKGLDHLVIILPFIMFGLLSVYHVVEEQANYRRDANDRVALAVDVNANFWKQDVGSTIRVGDINISVSQGGVESTEAGGSQNVIYECKHVPVAVGGVIRFDENHAIFEQISPFSHLNAAMMVMNIAVREIF